MSEGALTVKVLGTGTSQGVPVIGCQCIVCRSSDPRDNRLRCSIYISKGETGVAVDIGPDFRQQMLRAGLTDLDAVLLTHEHNDHVSGLDDVRPINFLQRKNIPLYGLQRTLGELRKRFSYVFDETYDYPGKPRVNLVPIEPGMQFEVGDLRFETLEVMHGPLSILGYRIGDFAYITDAKTLSDEVMEKLQGLKYLIINALHRRPHYTHLNLHEALELVADLDAQQVYLTHISHDMGLAAEVNKELPDRVELAYDGLEIML